MGRLWSLIARETGFRFLKRRRAAALVAIATMALALGANSAVESVVQAFLRSSFGLPEPDRTFVITPVRELPGRGEVAFADAYPNYVLIRNEQRSFVDVACVLQSVSSLDEGGESRTVQSAKVTASFFATMGVQPALGRAFELKDEGPSPSPVAVVSHALWQSSFDGDPDVVGRVMTLDGTPLTIVGVMPPGFAHPLPTDVWLPFDIPEQARITTTGARNLAVYGRVRAGVPRSRLTAEMEALTRRSIEVDAQNRDYRYVIRSISEYVLPGTERTVAIVHLGALVLTLLAVVNLSSLLIAWGEDRRREMAIRVALGAGGGTVARMLLLQSLAVVGAGAVGGLVLARALLPVIRRLDVTPELALYLGRLNVDGSVLLHSAAIATLAAVAAGTLPAVLGRREAVGDALRSAGRGSSQAPTGLRWQKAMVLTQSILTVIILTTAALIGVSFRNLTRVPDGFAAEGRVVARVQLTPAQYANAGPRVAFGERLVSALEREPALGSAAFTSTLPVGDARWAGRFLVELPDGTLAPDPLVVHLRRVSDRYFQTMAMPVLEGRPFDSRDGTADAGVAIVSRALAHRLWPNEQPVGRTLHRFVPAGPPQNLEVVGVVGDAMDGGYEAPPGETVYLPWTQNSIARMSIVVTPRTSPAEALTAVRRALRTADPVLAAGDVAELPALVRRANSLPRLQTLLLATFALVAIGIAGLGSYGVMSQLVASREREFALRLAIGARPGHIGAAVLSQAAGISGPGALTGLAASWLLGGALGPFLFGVDGRSLGVSGSVAATTVILVALAALPPALRAMRVKAGSALSGT